MGVTVLRRERKEVLSRMRHVTARRGASQRRTARYDVAVAAFTPK